MKIKKLKSTISFEAPANKDGTLSKDELKTIVEFYSILLDVYLEIKKEHQDAS